MKLIKIAYPWWNLSKREFDGPITAYIVPDLAPHLVATWVVYRRSDIDGRGWRGWWKVGNLETGAGIKASCYGRSATLAKARAVLETKTQAELDDAVWKVRRWQRGHA